MTLILQRSDIHGQGLFTTEPFRRGDYVGKLTGKRVSLTYNHARHHKRCANWFGLRHNYWLIPDWPFVRINHSCEPNIGLKGAIRFYAIRDIPSGSELTFDYSTAEEEMDWTMECSCRTPSCRRVIGSIQTLPTLLFNQYLPHIPTHFQQAYHKYQRNQCL